MKRPVISKNKGKSYTDEDFDLQISGSLIAHTFSLKTNKIINTEVLYHSEYTSNIALNDYFYGEYKKGEFKNTVEKSLRVFEI